MTTTLYVSGPMSGRPDHGWPEFIDATARLRAAGYRVISPHELWGEPRPELGRSYLLRVDLIAMLAGIEQDDGTRHLSNGADAVALLAGWKGSKGAALELTVARGLDMTIHPLGTWLAQAIHEGAHPGEIEQAGSAAVRTWRSQREGASSGA